MSSRALGTNTFESTPLSRLERAFRRFGVATLLAFLVMSLAAFFHLDWLVAIGLGLTIILALVTLVMRHLANDEAHL